MRADRHRVTQGVAAQVPTNRPLRVIAFGAHPDDAELKFAGTAALLAAQGHRVKLVSLTNGDVGHFAQSGGPLAQRRKAEVESCHKKIGVDSAVLDIHGELMPDLETRRKVVNLIREWQADVVLSHRPWDYHPDHRAVGKLAEDAASSSPRRSLRRTRRQPRGTRTGRTAHPESSRRDAHPSAIIPGTITPHRRCRPADILPTES